MEKKIENGTIRVSVTVSPDQKELHYHHDLEWHMGAKGPCYATEDFSRSTSSVQRKNLTPARVEELEAASVAFISESYIPEYEYWFAQEQRVPFVSATEAVFEDAAERVLGPFWEPMEGHDWPQDYDPCYVEP